MPEVVAPFRFQTKSFSCTLSDYLIEIDGRLYTKYSENRGFVFVDFDGEIVFYHYADENGLWLEYHAIFEYGKMIEAKRIYPET